MENLFYAVFFLVPGFAIIRSVHSTKGYRDLSAFEYSTVSISFSLLVFLLWFFVSCAVDAIGGLDYRFVETFAAVAASDGGGVEIPRIAGYAALCLGCFGTVAVTLLAAISISLNITKALGHGVWIDLLLASASLCSVVFNLRMLGKYS